MSPMKPIESSPFRILRKQRLVEIIALVSILVVIITFIKYLSLEFLINLKSDFGVAIFTGFLGAIISYLAMIFIQTLNKNPTSLTISLLGFPGAGKTVYLTVLFDQLQCTEETGIQFTPYGSETVENVFENLNILSKGQWLPPTKPGTVFYYRANASIGSGLSRKRYKIEVADFAGEQIGEFEPYNEKWLHKGDYFKYVTQSEAILLAVDCQVLITRDRAKIEEMQNAFVAAIQILIENKGVPENRRLHAPVALLFLKTDVLNRYLFSWDSVPGSDSNRLLNFLKDELGIFWVKDSTIIKINDRTIKISKKEESIEIILDEDEEKAILKTNDDRIYDFKVNEKDGKLKVYLQDRFINEEDLLATIPRLISVCKRRCESFRYFFVSSIGELGPEESPPETLNPQNVVDPIVWILKKA